MTRLRIPAPGPSPASRSASSTLPRHVWTALENPGQPLDHVTRVAADSRFGWDFTKVRIHSDDGAAFSALSEGARAYTVGAHSVFGPGRYAPPRDAGDTTATKARADVAPKVAPNASGATTSRTRLNAHSATSLLRALGPQPKLSVSRPGDALEREADRAADCVMRMADPSRATEPATSHAGAGVLQRKCATCDEEGMLHRDRGNGPDGGTTQSALPIVHDVLRSPGRSLDGATRSLMEPSFGRDFSDVRVHTDSRAAQSARDVNAHAYTVGRQIVFGSGHYAPSTQQGQRLLAHELTHVVQQSGGASAHIARQPADQTAPVPAGQTQAAPTQDDAQGVEGQVPSVEEAYSDAVAAAKAEGGQPTPGGQGGVGSSTAAADTGSAQALPSNTVECVSKWSSCRAPYSPGEWAARISYHCPVFPGFPGTTRPAYVDIPDEFVGVDPSGRDMYRCRPRSSVVNRATIADAFAFAITRQMLFPDFESCHAGFRAVLRLALEAMFRPSGGGRPAGIRVFATHPGGTFPC